VCGTHLDSRLRGNDERVGKDKTANEGSAKVLRFLKRGSEKCKCRRHPAFAGMTVSLI
jgi:hypothetical protein